MSACQGNFLPPQQMNSKAGREVGAGHEQCLLLNAQSDFAFLELRIPREGVYLGQCNGSRGKGENNSGIL